jgi:hypothetical protein
MSDYEPDYVYMIALKYKNKETFYETIETVPVKIKGAYMTDEDKQHNIDFKIVDPDGEVIYKTTSNVSIFQVDLKKKGRYKIIMNNKYENSEVHVTFTMRNGQNSIIKKDDLSISNQKLDHLLDFMKKFDLEFKFNRNMHDNRYKSKS